MTNSFTISGQVIDKERLPELIGELDLFPLLVRRLIERQSVLNVIPSNEEQITYYQKFLKSNRITNAEALQLWLQVEGISEQVMSKRLYFSLQIDQFKEQKFGSLVESVFLERKSQLDRVLYSLIRVKNREKATELHLKLTEEEATFSELASSYTEGLEKEMNGLLGPMELGSLNPSISERLKISQPGQLWPPFESNGWWVLLRLERILPASLDNGMYIRIINELYEEWMKLEVGNALSQLETDLKAEQIPVPDKPLPESNEVEQKKQKNIFQSLFGSKS